MLELRDYGRSGPLSGFVADPPYWLRPENGVVGVALAYDDWLVREIDRHYFRADRDGLEHSAAVAATLAQIVKATEGFETPSRPPGPYWYWQEILDGWIEYSTRRYGRAVSPIVVEITIGPEFPRRDGPDSIREHKASLSESSESSGAFPFYGEHRIVFRRAKRSKLQYAESGGRFIPDGPVPRDILGWGTLGGFVQALDKKLYAMTAAHVAHQPYGFGTPAFVTADYLGLRPAFQRIAGSSARLVPNRWTRQRGELRKVSQARLVPAHQCVPGGASHNDGLDVALIEWPDDVANNRRSIDVASLGEISQALSIRFTGAASGTQHVRVACYSIWHSYEMPSGQFACISDCLQIKHWQRPIVWEDVSTGGDSGSWVIANGMNGPYWVGLIVGGDGERTGVVPATRIMAHFRAEFGPLQPAI